jgi:geranylgeranyl diphosphate synthase type I
MATSYVACDALKVLANARELCEPGLREAVAWLADPLRSMSEYHFGWRDVDGIPAQAGWGKGIRAALVCAVAAACGADVDMVVPTATAVELVHNFTLIHDDVIDADQLRRGRATVWKTWGIPNAICLGDALHALAVRVLEIRLPGAVAADAVSRLEATVVRVCWGQSEDCLFETRTRVSVDEYLAMAAAKTGSLLGCACALGALCAGAGAETISKFEEFGCRLGLAFQVVDDVNGIWGDPAATGKRVGNDLIRHKRTFPVVAALESKSALATELSHVLESDGVKTLTEINRIAALLESSGVRRKAQRYADELVAAAVAALPERMATDHLICLAQLVRNPQR